MASKYAPAVTHPGDAFDPPLDPQIVTPVVVLRAAGIETFESCQGGPGHAYPQRTVRFHGDRSEGYRALAVVLGKFGLQVTELRRVWPIVDGEPTGPWWELTFSPTTDDEMTSAEAGAFLAERTAIRA